MNREEIQKLITDIAGSAVADAAKRIRDQAEENQRKIQSENKDVINAMIRNQDKSDKRQAGLKAARFIRCLAAAKGNTDKAADIAKKIGDPVVSKALAESTLSGGGALVPEEFVADVIELLRARTVVRAAGALSVPMNRGSLTLPYIASGASASYIGENTNISQSTETFGQLQLTNKKLAVLCPISNDLLADASPQVDTIVRNDLLQAASVREDSAFIRDNGTSNKPKGMRYWAPSGNLTVANSTVNVENVTTDLGTALLTLENGNIPMVSPGWLMAPRTKFYLMTARDGNNNLVWQPEMSQGTLMGMPFFTTTSIPTNLGSGTDESEVYLADFSQLVIAETSDMSVQVFEGATYYDGSSLVSGVSQDQTVIRLIARHDFGARFRGSEIAILTEVTWGA